MKKEYELFIRKSDYDIKPVEDLVMYSTSNMSEFQLVGSDFLKATLIVEEPEQEILLNASDIDRAFFNSHPDCKSKSRDHILNAPVLVKLKKSLGFTLVLLALVSCGSVEIPLFEKHLNKSGRQGVRQEAAVVMNVPQSRPYVCSSQSWLMKCSGVLPTTAILYQQAFYSPYCYQRYTNCLQFGGNR